MSFGERLEEIRTGFERPFWVANVTELFERLSYYAAFASLARYLNETLKFPVEQASSLTEGGQANAPERNALRGIRVAGCSVT